MERCILCGRKISDTRFNFGIGCLKKTCLLMNIDDISIKFSIDKWEVK